MDRQNNIVVEKAIYGNVSINRKFCPHCMAVVFVIDGKFICCDRDVEEPKRIKVKRMIGSRYDRRIQISRKIKTEVLKKQNNKCIYCDFNFNDVVWSSASNRYLKLKVHYDHFIPWSFSQNDKLNNIVAACNICNLLKSDFHFNTIEDAKNFIMEKRKAKGYW